MVPFPQEKERARGRETRGVNQQQRPTHRVGSSRAGGEKEIDAHVLKGICSFNSQTQYDENEERTLLDLLTTNIFN